MYTQRKVNIFGTEHTITMCHDSEDPREELVDWIAIQGPKIYKAWQEVGAM